MQTISAIVFDLGGVLLDLDQGKTLRAFKRLGVDLEDINLESTVFTEYETGKLSSEDFLQFIQTKLKGHASKEQITEAWNAMLLETTAERFQFLEQLRKTFRIYLLSNTNEIHIRAVHQYLATTFGLDRWNQLFDHQFLSYEMGLRKPDAACYQQVLTQIGKQPQEVLFIDDSHANIRGAAKVGIHTLLATAPLDERMMQQIKDTVKAWHQLQRS